MRLVAPLLLLAGLRPGYASCEPNSYFEMTKTDGAQDFASTGTFTQALGGRARIRFAEGGWGLASDAVAVRGGVLQLGVGCACPPVEVTAAEVDYWVTSVQGTVPPGVLAVQVRDGVLSIVGEEGGVLSTYELVSFMAQDSGS